MMEAELRNMLADGETLAVEFKSEEQGSLNDDDLVLAVVCLSNGEGGHLIVGVENDGRVTGARPRHEAGVTDIDRLRRLIASRTQPSLGCTVDLIAVDGSPVLVIGVPDAPTPVGTANGRYQRRALKVDGTPECLPYHAYEMFAHEIDRGARDYATEEVRGATWDDLDPLEFERFRRLIRERRGRGDEALIELSNEDIAKALGIVRADRTIEAIRAGAILLFGREDAIRRHMQTHEVAFQALRGTTVEVNEFFRWPLFRIADELASRFGARNREEEFQMGLVRVAVPLIPEVSFREAIANALVHRDYTRLGAVQVQWYEDRLEISNPGGFPSGVGLTNLLVAAPHPRSPVLADAFRRAGLVERTGRGIDLIYEGQLRYGRPAPDYGRSNAAAVVVVLHGGPANLEVARFVAEETTAGRRLSLGDLLVLNELVLERRLTIATAADLMQVDDRAARAQLNQMVDRGLLEARGERRGRTYHLSASVYRALGNPAAYVRVHGFEPVQQEQMILQYVDAHRTITRGQAADLCRIHPRQARRVLRELVGRGELVLRGQRRGSYYERQLIVMDNA